MKIRQIQKVPDFHWVKAGWRRSTDRTCLRPNSLLTGNFTTLVPRRPISLHEAAVLQAFPEQLPTQANGKIF
jgi:hypothetical protein